MSATQTRLKVMFVLAVLNVPLLVFRAGTLWTNLFLGFFIAVTTATEVKLRYKEKK